MKKQDLLELTGYVVQRHYVGKYGSPARKRYYYMLKLADGSMYRIRKYDVQDFVERGAKYKEIGNDKQD